jgi:hypothetical protein
MDMGTFFFSGGLTMKTFQSEWDVFAEAFINGIEVESQQWADMRIAFYAGAWTFRDLCENSPNTQDECARYLHSLVDEVDTFLRRVRRQIEDAKSLTTLPTRKERTEMEKALLFVHASGFSQESCERLFVNGPMPLRELAIVAFRSCINLGFCTQDAFRAATKICVWITRHTQEVL